MSSISISVAGALLGHESSAGTGEPAVRKSLVLGPNPGAVRSTAQVFDGSFHISHMQAEWFSASARRFLNCSRSVALNILPVEV